MSSDAPKLRALVVDDSAYNRQTIASMLDALPNVEVIGRAVNGKEALKLAFDLAPDVITLDLEMPEMDGFAFLRLLMAKRPTPVLVVSGYTQRDNVFRALELGALDFIAKPSREVSSDLKNIERDLVQKITVVRRLQAVRLRDRAQSLAAASRTARMAPFPGLPTTARSSPRRVIAIAASTGGPPAIQQLLCALPGDLPVAIIVAQHMPARFTRAFAERLDRLVGFRVVEARDGEPLCVGSVYIAPGSSNVEVERRVLPPWATVRVVSPRRERGVPTITPSADHLFKSLAEQYGRELCVVVLTGMGSDGREGSIAARHAGATVLAEDPASAVMPGMPYSTIEAGVVHGVHRLEELPTAIMQFARPPTESSS